jgi:small basic protein
LTYLGDQIGVQLYYAAIFTFGTRLFQNFAILRRFLLNKYTKKGNI